MLTRAVLMPSLLLQAFCQTTGAIPADQLSACRALGAWIARCWAPSTAVGSAIINPAVAGGESSTAVQVIDFTAPTTVDRVVLEEDQAAGQAIAVFTVGVVQLRPSTAPPATRAFANTLAKVQLLATNAFIS